MKRNYKRKIRLRKKEPSDEYRITFPTPENGILHRVTFTSESKAEIAEHRALMFSTTRNGGLDVTVEVGPADPFCNKPRQDRGRFWTVYGEMIYYRLPALVMNAASGLSRTVLAPPNRLGGRFHPEGRWRWTAPVSIEAHKPEAYWHRACVTLTPKELQPSSFEEMIHSYINGLFYCQPKKGTDVLLTYRAPQVPVSDQ